MKATKISLMAVLIAGVMLAYSPALRAQDAKDGKDAPKKERPPGGKRGDMAAKMAEDLKLTDDQKKKFEAAMTEQREKARAIRDDSSLSDDQKREKAVALRADLSKKMKEILTAEQYAQWEKMPRGPGGPGGKKKKAAEGDTK